MNQTNWDVIIVGAGASGMMCAIEAGKRDRKVLVLDHTKRAGRKIKVCGGGKCNFTNLTVEPKNFICANPHFVKSCTSRFTQWDFISLLGKYEIPWHERDHGQLFCDDSAEDIVNVLLQEARTAGVKFLFNSQITSQKKTEDGDFFIETKANTYRCQSLVIATGGLSYPGLGASGFAYDVANSYDIPVIPPRPGLVPLTFPRKARNTLGKLSGISLQVTVAIYDRKNEKNARSGKKKTISFTEALLFTFKGLSGPVILQASNYYKPGMDLFINLLPGVDLATEIDQWLTTKPKSEMKTLLAQHLPKRLIETLFETEDLHNLPLRKYGKKQLKTICEVFHRWQPDIAGTEGYKTAEVTIGGIDTDAINPKTMECRNVKGLYFVGEALDVTGWLGGYNLTFAWASGWAAGQVV